MVVSVTAEARCIVQVGAVLQQFGQLLGFLCNLLVGVDKFVPLSTSPGDLLWGPECCGTEQEAQEYRECPRMQVQFVVQLTVGFIQFEASCEQAINDGVFAGQDVVLDVVGLIVDQDVLAGLLLGWGAVRYSWGFSE